MDYRIRIEIETAGPDDFDQAKALFESDLDDQEFREYNLTVVDVAQLPISAIRLRHEVIWPPGSEEGGFEGPEQSGGLINDMNVRHPWDDGVWIFPVEHPFSALERAAYTGYNTAANVDEQRQIKRAIAALPPADHSESSLEGEVVDDSSS